MEYPEAPGQAASIASQALARMEQMGVAPHPRNYTIWYSYFLDHYPDLRRRMDTLLSEGTSFTETVGEELYNRYFTAQEETDGIASTGLKLEVTLEQMRTLFSSAHAGTEAYNRTLESFSGEVQGAEPQHAERLIATVLDETQRMLATNRALGEELARSSDEVRKLREDLDRVRLEALTDGLTGIANRRVFDATIRDLTHRAARDDLNGLSLLMVDIDHFKRFNDTFGHQMGDQVLRLVARLLQQGVDAESIATRYGGEEFAVLMPNIRVRDAVATAETIRRQVASKRVTNRRTNQDLGCITLSIGVSEYVIGEAIGQFIQRADEALYMAKGEGRNRVVSQMELELRRAGAVP
ncbi:GGDEF domain-containing protein [Pararhodospirillum oryzae]|nr:diguanylate cyclase [Pararhodospirillum oryzae]